MSLCLLSGLQLQGTEGDWLGGRAVGVVLDLRLGGPGGPGGGCTGGKGEHWPDSLAESTRNLDDLHRARYLTATKDAGSIEAMHQLDDLLFQLARGA